MHITLYMAISIDGFIAKANGDSDWVSPLDTPNFEAAIQDHGNIIVGSRTFKQYFGDLYPVKGVNNLVISSNPRVIETGENVFVLPPQPEKVLEFLTEKGQNKALLIGGGKTNGLFLKTRIIDEMRLVVHPLALGKGIKLFEGAELNQEFELVSSKELGEGLIQVRYVPKHT